MTMSNAIAKQTQTNIKRFLELHDTVATHLGPGVETVRVVAYSEVFTMLWANAPLPELPVDSTLILIDDGPPPRTQSSPIDLQPHLTPLDWVVCSLQRSTATSEVNQPRIIIVQRNDSVPPFESVLRDNPNLVPWVRWFDIRNPKYIIDIAALKNDLQFRATPESMTRARTMLTPIWKANLLKPSAEGNHHALANLIGPLLFTAGRTDDPQVAAFYALLQSLEVIPKAVDSASKGIPWLHKPWRPRIREFVTQSGRTELNVLLVDDCAFNSGWATVVAAMLDLDADLPQNPEGLVPVAARELDTKPHPFTLQFSATAQPGPWLEALGVLPATVHPDDVLPVVDDRFAFPLRKSPAATVDILILDLRLFQGQPLEVEGQFVQRLLPWARGYEVATLGSMQSRHQPNREFPWPGFAPEELRTLKKWVVAAVAGDSETALRVGPIYDLVLSLLPRLMALRDCALPILLFSSTGRRGVLEHLRAYPTILTRFEKPRITPDFSPADQQAAFAAEFATALDLATARAFAGRMLQESNAVRLLVTDKVEPAEVAAGPWRVVLTIDETNPGGDQKILRVGGILALYPPGVDPDVLDKALGEKIGITVWNRAAKNRLKTLCPDIASYLNTDNAWSAVTLQAVSVMCETKNLPYLSLDDTDELRDERVADNLWRRLFRGLVEYAIFGVARALLPANAKVLFNIKAGTRVMTLPDVQESDSYVEKVRIRWGILSERGEGNVWVVNFFEPRDVRPIIEEIQELYDDSSFAPHADIARAYRMNNDRVNSNEYALVGNMLRFTDALLAHINLHHAEQKQYEADRKRGKQVNPPPRYNDGLQYFLDTHIEIVHPHPLEALIEGHRAGAHGRFADVLAAAGRIWIDHTHQRDQYLVADAASVHAAASQLSGDEFLEFARLLHRPQGLKPRRVKTEGKLIAIEQDYVVLIADVRKFRARKSDRIPMIIGQQYLFNGIRGRSPGELFASDLEVLPPAPGVPGAA